MVYHDMSSHHLSRSMPSLGSAFSIIIFGVKVHAIVKEYNLHRFTFDIIQISIISRRKCFT